MIMRTPKLLITIFSLTLFAQLTSKVSAADTNSYIGAVAEYYPVTKGINGSTIATENAKNYITIIRTAWEYNVDIIVFPEDSLTAGLNHSATDRTLYSSYSSIIPEPGTDIPCDNSTSVVIKALQLISCAAKKHQIYVVVNLHERENCTTTGTKTRPCPRDGFFFYNTNVVFNRTGGIISKYRKYNLFSEPGINVTSVAENSTFTTDFNVKFGHIICFDIYFKTPALSLINEYNVADILTPARWFSELPYITTVQTQSSWSYANNVNLLAAGYNDPSFGNGGSGIYAGTSGNLITHWSERPKNAILVAKIPKVINSTRSYLAPSIYPLIYEFSQTEISTTSGNSTVLQQELYWDYLQPYITSVLKLVNGTTTTKHELCDRQLCCSFYVNNTFNPTSINSSASYYRYRFAVFNGVRLFSGGKTAGVQTCGVVSCTNDTLDSCGKRFAATETVARPTIFNDIVIFGNFSTNSTTFQMPNSLTMNMIPLNASDFTYAKTNIPGTLAANVTYNLTTATDNLLTFAIYGRNFSADGLPATTSNGSSPLKTVSGLLLMLTVLLPIVPSFMLTRNW